MRTGGVVSIASLTVMVNVVLPIFPAASVAVHVTVVTPRGNKVPDGGVHLVSIIGDSYIDYHHPN